MTRPFAERCSSTGRIGSIQTLSVTEYSASSRLEAVSSGPTTLKLLLGRLSFITSRKNVPKTRVASEFTPPGFGTSTP